MMLTHGKKHSRVYRSYHHMKERCLSPNCKEYKHYGARGITVCDDWMKFENFYRDMGDPEFGYTLDRIDNNGNYCKENCKWSTQKEQVRNRSITKKIIYNGVERVFAELCEEVGLIPQTVANRINNLNWPIEKAFKMKLHESRKR